MQIVIAQRGEHCKARINYCTSRELLLADKRREVVRTRSEVARDRVTADQSDHKSVLLAARLAHRGIRAIE